MSVPDFSTTLSVTELHKTSMHNRSSASLLNSTHSHHPHPSFDGRQSTYTHFGRGRRFSLIFYSRSSKRNHYVAVKDEPHLTDTSFTSFWSFFCCCYTDTLPSTPSPKGRPSSHRRERHADNRVPLTKLDYRQNAHRTAKKEQERREAHIVKLEREDESLLAN